MKINKFNEICSIAMKHFKVGDIVELVDNSCWIGGEIGEKYIIKKIISKINYNRICVWKCGTSVGENSVFAHRFKKIESK